MICSTYSIQRSSSHTTQSIHCISTLFSFSGNSDTITRSHLYSSIKNACPCDPLFLTTPPFSFTATKLCSLSFLLFTILSSSSLVQVVVYIGAAKWCRLLQCCPAFPFSLTKVQVLSSISICNGEPVLIHLLNAAFDWCRLRMQVGQSG